jgi:hypothetical protein
VLEAQCNTIFHVLAISSEGLHSELTLDFADWVWVGDCFALADAVRGNTNRMNSKLSVK